MVEWHLAPASSSVAVCDETARIDTTCGNCGPSWGNLQQCKDLCSAVGRRRRSAEPACQYITFFSDEGCRAYTACDSTYDQDLGVTTTIYGVGPALGPFFFSSVPDSSVPACLPCLPARLPACIFLAPTHSASAEVGPTVGTCDFVTGDGIGGNEILVGNADSADECFQMVRSAAPTANGAKYSNDGDTQCYAELGMTSQNTNSDWQTCQFGEDSPLPPLLAPNVCTSLCVGEVTQRSADVLLTATPDSMGFTIEASGLQCGNTHR